MSNTVRIRRRAAGGAAGAPASLYNGEIAFNEQDKVLYYGYGTFGTDGSASQIIAIGGPGANLPASHLTTARNINITGGAVGSVQFDGSADATINVTLNAESVQDIVGGMLLGSQNGIVVAYDDPNGVVTFNVADFTITHTGDVTGTATIVDLGNVNYALTIANGAVTNAKLANMASGTIKGRKSAGNGSPEDLTGNDVLDMIAGTTNGNAPANQILAGPTSGAATKPTFRGIVDADIPASIARTASPIFTGNPTAPTPNNGDNSGSLATTAFVRATRLDQLTAPAADVSFGGHKITGLADPVNAQDAATKNYVDNAVQGIDHKKSVLVATTGNIALNGLQVVDNVQTAEGSRVLVKDQNAPTDNGVWLASAAGWTRAPDCDSFAELVSAFVFVEEGDTWHDKSFVCTVDPGGALGTTSVTWTIFGSASSYQAGNGLQLTGNSFAVQGGAGITVGANVALTGQALAFHNLASFGMVALTAAGTVAARTITGTGNQITVTNGDGVGGNPTIGMSATYPGQASINTLGAVTAGQWQATAIGIAYGGHGATTAAGARTNLGLAIGADVQAHNANLDALAGLAGVADKVAYFTGAGALALASLTAFGRSLVAGADAATVRGTLGLGSMALQNSNAVTITGGTIDGVTLDCGTF